MASRSWIDSAATQRRPVVGSGIEQDSVHVLYLPKAEREYAIKERQRARPIIQRLASEDAAEFLAMLGLVEEVA